MTIEQATISLSVAFAQCWEIAALRDFSSIYVRFGSSTTDAVEAARSFTFALPRKRPSASKTRFCASCQQRSFRLLVSPISFSRWHADPYPHHRNANFIPAIKVRGAPA
jgi:hypothetical protein